jgi:hypothetical protein
MAREQPLSLRLYFQPHLYELAQAIGYEGLPVRAAKERVRSLTEKYGRERMVAASKALVRIDPTTDPPTARLKDDVRKLCWQLLGPPPEESPGNAPGERGASAP